MKLKTLLIAILFLCYTAAVHSQNVSSPFRSGYIRLGLNTFGKTLDNNLSPAQNVFDGRYGASTGYVFEFGHIFSFNKKSADRQKISYGLDWTILSFNYNKMDKWEDYGSASGAQDISVDGKKIAAAISSKLGPSISFNPVEKFVIDARFQVIPVARFFDFEYYDNQQSDEMRSFSFQGESEDVKNRIAFGVATGFGLTVRRGAIGLSLDYITGKVNSNYSADEGADNYISGKAKIPVNNLQFKLNLTL